MVLIFIRGYAENDSRLREPVETRTLQIDSAWFDEKFRSSLIILSQRQNGMNLSPTLTTGGVLRTFRFLVRLLLMSEPFINVLSNKLTHVLKLPG